MSDTGIDGWHNAYLRARQIESEIGLPVGSIKSEVTGTGRFSLVFVHMTEEQIRQMTHLWFVLSQTAQVNQQAHPVHPPKHPASIGHG